MRKHFIGIAVFAVITLGWALLYQPNPHPSDAALIDYFQKHRAGFDKLARMAQEDSNVQAIYSDQVMLINYKIWPKDTEEGFTKQRWSEYQNVFAKLKEYHVNIFTKASGVHISVSSDFSDTDDYGSIMIEKGYAYSLVEPAPLVESLDNMGFDNKGTYYRKIDEHWYLYHEWSVDEPE